MLRFISFSSVVFFVILLVSSTPETRFTHPQYFIVPDKYLIGPVKQDPSEKLKTTKRYTPRTKPLKAHSKMPPSVYSANQSFLSRRLAHPRDSPVIKL